MKSICFLVCLVAAAAAVTNSEWEDYKKAFGKSYKTTTEDHYRLKIFLSNKAEIDRHNALFEKGQSTYARGINRFTDMNTLEVSEIMNGYVPSANINQTRDRKYGIPYVRGAGLGASTVQETVDWRNSGCVTPVKDQGGCGSCWAFSVTGSLEGQNCIANWRLVSLSEQELVDCGARYFSGLYGCGGGNNELGFLYVMYNGGIDREETYPYEGLDKTCRFSPSLIGGTAKSYSYFSAPGCEECLRDVVSEIGPISVGIDAGKPSFQQYQTGIYYEPTCSTTALNHAVLVVGYGNANGQDYWLVKNSWGTRWGEQGYIRMARNRSNNCGIATDISWPNVK